MWLFLSVVWTSALQAPLAAPQNVAPLAGERWEVFGMITGFHSIVHKKAGLEIRVLEADGSASVAWDPISLFVVVTNNGTSDHVERVWRLPEGVEKVKALTATACGADIRVETDHINSEELVDGTVPKIFRLCFLSATHRLDDQLTFKEVGK
jgi:hypothetical protein